MIVNVRGCSGSGKSWIGFQLYDEYKPWTQHRDPQYFNLGKRSPTWKGKVVYETSECLPDVALAGRYVLKHSTIPGVAAGYSGGIDGYYPMDEVTRLADDLEATFEHVYLEALLLSSTYSRWHDYALRHPNRVAFVTLKTPLDVCIERVLSRNQGTAVKEDQIAKHQHQCLKCGTWFERDVANGEPFQHYWAETSEEGLQIVKRLFGLAG